MSEEHIPFVAADPAASPKQFPSTAIIAGGIFLTILLAVIYWMSHRPPAPPPPPPSAESLAYLPQIALTDFHMSAADNLIGSNLIYLDGKVANNGHRLVRHLRVRLYFYDAMNQLVLREEQNIISPGDSPLAAGETRDFQLRFDRLPSSWNYQPPQFRLVSLAIQ
jgi:hypothetical protein